MYNEKIRFDGDIIITDPCYIINKNNENFTDSPCWWDYVSRVTTEERVAKDGTKYKTYHMPKHKDYPDARPKTMADCRTITQKFEVFNSSKPIMFSPTFDEEMEKYRKDEEEWHSEPHDDWERCEYGENMSALGFTKFLSEDTKYGDWSCTTINSDTKEKIGEFCADAGMVGVFLLDEVLKYNPDFDYHINRPWTTTLIRNFHGYVSINLNHDDGEEDVRVVGEGNINFMTYQSGL